MPFFFCYNRGMNIEKKRYTLIDILRSFAMIAMIFYHAVWDLVYIFDVDVPWFSSQSAAILQMSIRLSFIILSGFCWSMSRNNLKRGCIVYIASWIITIVTMLFMPNQYILFGVLSLIGSAMLFTLPLDSLFKKINPYIGILACSVLFILFKQIMNGYIGIGNIELLQIPSSFYNSHIGAYLGFPDYAFQSTDYVPIFPWLFVFWIGYFIYQLFKKRDWLKHLKMVESKPLEWIGRNSLLIYMVHQPIIYVILYLVCR